MPWRRLATVILFSGLLLVTGTEKAATTETVYSSPGFPVVIDSVPPKREAPKPTPPPKPRKIRVVAEEVKQAPPVPPGEVEYIIREVFGKYADQALSVAWCESRYRTDAVNGQYLGLFQMGSWERSKYGHGPDAKTQAVSAFNYFAATGFDWSPWKDCI